MSTTKTTKDEATAFKMQIETEFKGQPWFKKAVVEADDHGWCLGIHINKPEMEAAGFKIPHQTNVKIVVFNRA
jgi:hypothetical protein